MTEDEIIQMAVECGIIPWTKHEYIGGQKFTATDEGLDGDIASLVQFFQIATTREREACAKIADTWKDNVVWEARTAADNIGREIRARGNNGESI